MAFYQLVLVSSSPVLYRTPYIKKEGRKGIYLFLNRAESYYLALLASHSCTFSLYSSKCCRITIRRFILRNSFSRSVKKNDQAGVENRKYILLEVDRRQHYFNIHSVFFKTFQPLCQSHRIVIIEPRNVFDCNFAEI